MAWKLVAGLLLILFALALGQGCTSPVIPEGGAQQGGPLATPGSQSGGSGSVPTPYPGPVVTVPPDFGVEVQINKNMIFTNPAIDVYYRGGKGQVFLQRMFVQVFKSDGTFGSGELVRPEGGQIKVGDKVTIQGTTGTDRVIVIVNIPALGREFKIRDENLEFKTRP